MTARVGASRGVMRHLDELATLRVTVRALRLAFTHLPGTIVGLYGLDGMCILLEGAATINVTATEGRHYTEFTPLDRLERFERLFKRAREGQTTTSDYPIGERMYEATTKGVADEKGAVRWVMFYVRDVTAERAALVALRVEGGKDSLTGLPRRGVLEAHVSGLVRKAQPFHVLFIDLDGFKRVNDTRGHEVGDSVLEKVGGALRSSVRTGDLAVRLGGDEFVVVLGEASPRDAASRLLRALLVVTEPFGAGASVGYASFPEHGRDLVTLLAEADRAMYRAKRDFGGATVESA